MRQLILSSAVLGSFGLLGLTVFSGTPDAAHTQPVAAQQTGVKRFGATGNGRTDDTAAIQQAVNSSVGDIRFPRGVYRISRTIVIDLDHIGPTALIGEGPARIVMTGPGPAFRFIGTHEGTAAPKTVRENIWKNQRTPMVTGLEIVGKHPQADGIEAVGTMQLTVSRVVIRKAWHGIHLVKRNRNVIVSACHIYDNSGVGIFYDHVNLHQSNIIGSHISYNDGGGVVIQGGNVRNVQIGTCDIEGNMGGPNSKPTANVLLDATGGSIGEVAIVGCTIQHTHRTPDSANIRINGNSTPVSFTKETRHGNITIADNVLSDVQTNIDVQNTRSVTITGNTIWKGYAHNLRVISSDGVVVADNVFDRNPRYHYGDGSTAHGGLVFRNCNGGTISGNHLRGTGDIPAAMFLQSCRRFNITGCTILDAMHGGLRLDDVSDSRVSDCLIRDDRTRGKQSFSLRMTGGHGNMVVNNLFGVAPVIASGAAQVQGNLIGRTK